jgi:hypothetical protein
MDPDIADPNGILDFFHTAGRRVPKLLRHFSSSAILRAAGGGRDNGRGEDLRFLRLF